MRGRERARTISSRQSRENAYVDIRYLFVRRLPLFNRNTHHRMHTHLVNAHFFFFFLPFDVVFFSRETRIYQKKNRNAFRAKFLLVLRLHSHSRRTMLWQIQYIVCANPAFTTRSSLPIAFCVLTDESVNYYGLALFILLHCVSLSHFVCVYSA